MSINSNSTNLQLDTKRHSFAHLMAAAVGQMFPEAQYGVGPVIETGCYYDFVLPRNLIPEDLPLLENHIKDLLKRDLRFKVQELTLEDAIAHFANAHQPLKVELLENLRDRGTTSMSEEEKADFGMILVSDDEGNLTLKDKSETVEGHIRNLFETKIGNTLCQQNVAFDRNADITHYKIIISDKKNKIYKINGNSPEFSLNQIKNITNATDSTDQKYNALIQTIASKLILDPNKLKLDGVKNNDIFGNLNTFYFNYFGESENFMIEPTISTPTITIYRIVDEKTGEVVFEDLCKGPHVWGVRVNQESVKDLNLQNMGFRLDKFSASYWRGDQARGINMQRLYALVFETKDELKTFVTQREEAKKRDHRVLNQTQKYFTISELVGAGLPLFQPNGMLLRKNIQNYLWQLHAKKGYKEVWTPHIAKEELYITSGHAAKFGDELFKVQGKTENFFMKPMNCPHHMQIFADNQFSYRDMPVRYFEHATVYRDEKPGQLSGFTRVRSITQDDGHLFCRVGQIKQEVSTIVAIIREFYDTIGMEASWVSLSVRDMNDLDKYLGGNEVWELAEKSLEEAAIENKLNYKRVEGEAAFYGPKLDFMFKDCMGREWQLATIQCDFNLPEKFDLSFVNEESVKERPVVIHRAISGSVERFLGVIIDNFAGKFPFWLSPEQIRILTINDEVLPFVDKIKAELDQVVLMQPLKYNELRYSVDDRMESLGKKIRDSKLDKIPMFIVVGMKDVEEGIVSIEYGGESVKVPLGEVKAWMEGVE
jgi:threonyl-tRNA synthetase